MPHTFFEYGLWGHVRVRSHVFPVQGWRYLFLFLFKKVQGNLRSKCFSTFFFLQFYLMVYFSNCSLLRFVLIEQKISFTWMFILLELCTGNIFSCCFSFFCRFVLCSCKKTLIEIYIKLTNQVNLVSKILLQLGITDCEILPFVRHIRKCWYSKIK